MSKEKFTGVKGMNDMLPQDAAIWHKVEETAIDVLERYGFQEIRTPILENTKVFTRGVGEVTDIVEKEMYSFVDSMNGDQLTLRPECTSAVVRAVNEHNLLYGTTQRLWYIGPMFRHERPQRGRYRQFYQLGAEALGMEGPDIDAEMIIMLSRLWKALGIDGVRLELNTLGALPERQAHREALIRYFEEHKSELDEDALRRLYTNPLRILDTKNPDMQDLVNNAPRLLDFLGEESRAFLARLEKLLEATGIEYTIPGSNTRSIPVSFAGSTTTTTRSSNGSRTVWALRARSAAAAATTRSSKCWAAVRRRASASPWALNA